MRALDLTLQQSVGAPTVNLGASGLSRFLVFDTETTGIGAGHRVVEIGVVEIINRRATGREFHTYINPERSIDADAERVHGLNTRFLADKPKFRDVHQDFIDFLGEDGQLVAHNATFDINMLNAEFERLGVKYRINQEFEIVDTMKLSRKIHPGQRATLDAICTRFNVSTAERTNGGGLHGALIDSRILSRAFLAMTAGQVHFGYSEGRQAVAATGVKLDRSKIGPLTVVTATPEETAAHSRLCDAIEKSSGGYCGFRGKWTRPEKGEHARVEAAPVAEFGSGTIAAAKPAPVPTSSSAPSAAAVSTASTPLTTPASAPTIAEIEFAPSI